MVRAAAATMPIRVIDWNAVNAMAPGTSAVKKLASGAMANATRNGRRLPYRSPYRENMTALRATNRVVAKIQLI